MTKKGYAGKISNKGIQSVDAVFKQSGTKGGVVKEGSDLRTKKANK